MMGSKRPQEKEGLLILMYFKSLSCASNSVGYITPKWTVKITTQLLPRRGSLLHELQYNTYRVLNERGWETWYHLSFWNHYAASSKTQFLISDRSGSKISSTTWAVWLAINHIRLWDHKTAMFLKDGMFLFCFLFNEVGVTIILITNSD